jgi:large subunit ribosomal protein L1
MSRSKRYQEVAKKIDANKLYLVDDAIKLVKETSTTKFDGSVELHIRVGIDATKGEQQVRGTVPLPHGSGKTVKIAVFAEGDKAKDAKAAGADVVGGLEMIEEIKSTGKINFEIALATPDMMKNLAKVAKILGPKGLMPSPKNETVTMDITKTVGELKKGKVAFKNDTTGNVHMVIGKISFTPDQIKTNFLAAMDAIRKAKPAASKGTYIQYVSLNATMGPGIAVTLA